MSEHRSRPVHSTQQGPHPRLESLVRRHLQHPFARPFAEHTRRAYEQLLPALDRQRPLILDSFCGVGQSTAWLARQYPDCQVIGVDKSAARLGRHQRAAEAGTYWLVRADTDDFWRLLQADGWQLKRHCIFYPNPWPKPGHLQRRIHGSPLWPTLLALGGELEVRSNWPVYIEECAQALALSGYHPQSAAFTAAEPITPFEAKYQASGQSLWRCICSLN